MPAHTCLDTHGYKRVYIHACLSSALKSLNLLRVSHTPSDDRTVMTYTCVRTMRVDMHEAGASRVGGSDRNLSSRPDIFGRINLAFELLIVEN